MADSTTNYSFNKPTVGGDSDAWGGHLNDNWDDLDDLLSGTGTVDGVDVTNATGDFTTIDAAGGTLTDMTLVTAVAGMTSGTVEENIGHNIQSITGTSPAIDAEDGAVGTWVLTASTVHTPTITVNATDGYSRSLTLVIQVTAGATITWPGTILWLNGEPTLADGVVNVVTFFNDAIFQYGVFVGNL